MVRIFASWGIFPRLSPALHFSQPFKSHPCMPQRIKLFTTIRSERLGSHCLLYLGKAEMPRCAEEPKYTQERTKACVSPSGEGNFSAYLCGHCSLLIGYPIMPSRLLRSNFSKWSQNAACTDDSSSTRSRRSSIKFAGSTDSDHEMRLEQPRKPSE